MFHKSQGVSWLDDQLLPSEELLLSTYSENGKKITPSRQAWKAITKSYKAITKIYKAIAKNSRNFPIITLVGALSVMCEADV